MKVSQVRVVTAVAAAALASRLRRQLAAEERSFLRVLTFGFDLQCICDDLHMQLNHAQVVLSFGMMGKGSSSSI